MYDPLSDLSSTSNSADNSALVSGMPAQTTLGSNTSSSSNRERTPTRAIIPTGRSQVSRQGSQASSPHGSQASNPGIFSIGESSTGSVRNPSPGSVHLHQTNQQLNVGADPRLIGQIAAEAQRHVSHVTADAEQAVSQANAVSQHTMQQAEHVVSQAQAETHHARQQAEQLVQLAQAEATQTRIHAEQHEAYVNAHMNELRPELSECLQSQAIFMRTLNSQRDAMLIRFLPGQGLEILQTIILHFSLHFFCILVLLFYCIRVLVAFFWHSGFAFFLHSGVGCIFVAFWFCVFFAFGFWSHSFCILVVRCCCIRVLVAFCCILTLFLFAFPE